MLELVHIHLEMNNKLLYNNINLELNKGSITVVIEDADSGRVELLKVIAGIYPARDRIYLSGEDISDIPMNKRDVEFILQDLRLSNDLNIVRNIGMRLGIESMQFGVLNPRVMGRIDKLLMRRICTAIAISCRGARYREQRLQRQ